MIKICVALLIISSVELAEIGKHEIENMGTTYTDVKVGTGRIMTGSDTATFHVTGKFSNGDKFWSSKDDNGEPLTFSPKDDYVKGIKYGVRGMQPGGIRQIYVPYTEAFDNQDSLNFMPPMHNTQYDVELLSLKDGERPDSDL